MPYTTRRLTFTVRASMRACAPCLLAAAGSVCWPIATTAQELPVTTAAVLSPGADLAGLVASVPPDVGTAEERRLALDALPREGEVTMLDKRAVQRLEQVQALLRSTGRAGTHTVKVVDMPQAGVALYARSVILVTSPTLGLLEGGELAAIVAHELGHEYLWAEWMVARSRGDTQQLRDIEIACDLLALALLNAGGVDSSRLLPALEKVTYFNVDRFGAAPSSDAYPRLSARRKVLVAAMRRHGRR